MSTVWPRAALVIGGSRGLGRALTNELIARSVPTVIVTIRDTGATLDWTDPVRVIGLDYTIPETIEAAAIAVADMVPSLDLLINCGAVNVAPELPREETKGPLAALSAAALRVVLDTNVVGPLMAMRSFVPLLSIPGGAMVNVTSSRGSLASASDGANVGYAISKAALNMATRKVAAEVAPLNCSAIAIDPGWIRTDMGGAEAPRPASAAAADIVDLLASRRGELNGQFVTANGRPIPW